MKNVLLVCPSWFPDWHRYDNIIDYVESTKGAANSCKVLTYGIWPYVGQFVDLRTYQPADDLAREFWYNLNSIPGSKKKQRNIFLSWAITLSKDMGFADIEEAKRMIVPKVPVDIELFCRWLNLFSDDSTIYELKPMMYTYWS